MPTLLHIGAPKTGTTAIQASLEDLKSRSPGGLEAFGLSMPGTPLEQARAALGVLGQGVGWQAGERAHSDRHWRRLLAQAAPGLRFVSSEYLCEATPEVADRIVADLGGRGQVRVVLTLRPLTRIMPSAWQQYLKSGHQLDYAQWCSAMLASPPKRGVTPSFWRRHDQGAVLQRWTEAAGAENLTTVVLDPADRGLLMRTFDDLLHLPAGTLTGVRGGRQNRSMSAAETELFRRLNVQLRERDFPWREYADLVRYGSVLRTVELMPSDEEAAVHTPEWAVERAVSLAQGYRDTISALEREGMTVIGDADLLTEAYAGAPQAAPAPGLVPVDTAVQAILGVVSRASSGNAFFPDEVARGIGEQDGLPGSARSQKELARVEDLSAREISEVLAGRLRKGVQRRYRKQRRRLQRIADRHAVSLPRARDRSGDEVLHTAAADTPDQFG
ncbi:hypothetical protein LWF15_34675 [Kineosporia rhizophila]|uniref:hypothetical protein n=1 Tax=Kineosporia TaxID=49184 RepID=UPI001E38BC83|nr:MULTISPECIES: hypothetical protein [Kineosporia]MCE0540651.1 hypothetical protein [Kineosporia rhizophila]GLY17278.1 hypothetical protein Kisp01_42930 [Kineosporia sp. NBRC 101677]